MGDVHRIPRSRDRSYSDPEFAKLLSVNPDRLCHKLSPFFTRPAYSYTKAAVGGIKDVVQNV